MNTTDYAQISSSNIRFLLTKNNISIRQLAEKNRNCGHHLK